jgi:hypothetical protein
VVALPYDRQVVGSTTIVARRDLMAAFVHATHGGSLYEWAARQPERRAFTGRLPAYAVRLPFDGPAVVVRHNHHGGWMAKLRGDRFVLPRAPLELAVAEFLRSRDIATPAVLGFVITRESFFTKRSDVATAELPSGFDLGAVLTDPHATALRTEAWPAVRHLLHDLAAAGAWHPDLNVKNIHLSRADDGTVRAAVLDVDRVRLGEPGEIVAKANAGRLRRSLERWQRQYGVQLSADERAMLDIPTGRRA